VTAVTGDKTQATASLAVTAGGKTLTGLWQCSAAGIANYDSLDPIALDHAVTNVQASSQTGVWLLPADQLSLGAHWDQDYSLNYDVTSGTRATHLSGTVSQHYVFGGMEQVTVGGVTYTALRVDNIRTLDFTADSRPYNHSLLVQQFWFVRGVGLVRFVSTIQSSSGGGVGHVSTQELKAYNIP
jgi:hypothetical protein